MQTLFLVVQVIVAIMFIFAVLLQQKASGMGAALGGSGGFQASKRGVDKLLANASLVLFILFLGLSFGSALI